MQKFNYLKSFLKGEALKAIKGLPMQNNIYKLAIKSLEELYGNKNLIVSAANKAFRNIRSTNLHPKNLRTTFNLVDNLLSTMKLAGEDIDNTLYKTIMLEKFPHEVVLEVQKKLMNEDLSTDDIRTHINKEILARQQTSFIHQYSNKQYSDEQQSDEEHTNENNSDENNEPADEALLSFEKRCIFCR